MENKYRLATQWKRSDAEYAEVKVAYIKEMQERLRESLWATV